MISPLTMLVVLATTLTIASPLPEPEMSGSVTTTSAAAPRKTGPVSHGLVRVGTEKMVDLNCVGKVDSNGGINTLSFHVESTNAICKRRRRQSLCVQESSSGRLQRAGTKPAPGQERQAYVNYQFKAHNYIFLQATNVRKAQNKAGKTFPRKFDVNGTGTDVKALFSKDCPQRKQVNATFYQFPVGSTEAAFAGGETTQDRVLAFAHGKWPNFSKVAFCGVMTHRGQNAKVYTTCQKKQGPIEE